MIVLCEDIRIWAIGINTQQMIIILIMYTREALGKEY